MGRRRAGITAARQGREARLTLPLPASSRDPVRFAVLLTNREGRVSYCSRSAKAYLAAGAVDVAAHAKMCWQVTGFRRHDGSPFCGPDCPIQRLARRGVSEPRDRVVLTGHRREPTALTLTTFLVSPRGTSRRAALHLLQPLTCGPPARLDVGEAHVTPHLERLSRREREVLRLLAGGLSTRAVGRRLCISPITVRNHVQSILGKLGLHRRIEAVLALVRG